MHPPAAKAEAILDRSTARLKPCPSKAALFVILNPNAIALIC